jgi:predicted alpha/beta hydrolase
MATAVRTPVVSNQRILDDDEVRFVPDQHADMDLYCASSLKQQSADRYVAPLGHIILIPERHVYTGAVVSVS